MQKDNNPITYTTPNQSTKSTIDIMASFKPTLTQKINRRKIQCFIYSMSLKDLLFLSFQIV